MKTWKKQTSPLTALRRKWTQITSGLSPQQMFHAGIWIFLSFAVTSLFFLTFVTSGRLKGHAGQEVIYLESENVINRPAATVEGRIELLRSTCQKYADSQRPESKSLFPRGQPGGQQQRSSQLVSLGVEVVYLFEGSQAASVCIPHKVGSHSWGRFAQTLGKNADLFARWQRESWAGKFKMFLFHFLNS